MELETNIIRESPQVKKSKFNFIKDIINFAERIGQKRQQIILKNSYFPRLVELQLILTTFFLVGVNRNNTIEFSSYTSDSIKRGNLRKLETGEGEKSEFIALLLEMLPADMPQSFIEVFEIIKEKSKNYPNKPKAIFSSNSWYYDEVFKQWAATAAEKGTQLIGTQHGGNYGGLKYMSTETHEIIITDKYYSWGWLSSIFPSKVIPMPATKLMGKKRTSTDNKQEGVLYATTSWPRYLCQFPFVPIEFSDYLIWQRRFIQALSPEIYEKMRVRPHYADLGWDIVQRLRDQFRDIKIETWNIPFMDSLENSRLYVCDHCSTTFIEALAANNPTILFWDPKSNELKPESQLYYDELKRVGILYDSPEDAAAAVKMIYNNVENWWNDQDRQAVRQAFCYRFARTSPDALREWVREFKKIVMGVKN